MVSGLKGLTWVGNIYQKIEDGCLELDDLITKESYSYVQNQIQTAGANVKQFCSGFIEEVLATSTVDNSVEGKPVDSSLVQNKESMPCENSTMNNTEHTKLELFEEVLAASSVDDSAKEEPMNSSLVQNNGSLPCKNSTMNDNEHAKLEFIEEVLAASSLDSAKEHMDSLQTNKSLPCENSSVNSEHAKLEFIEEVLVALSADDSGKEEPVDASLVQKNESLPCENSTMNNSEHAKHESFEENTFPYPSTMKPAVEEELFNSYMEKNVAIRVEKYLEVGIMEKPIEEKQNLSQVSKTDVDAFVEEATSMEFNERSDDLTLLEKGANKPSTEAIQLFDEYFTVADTNEVNVELRRKRRTSAEGAFINSESLNHDFSDSEWEII